MRNILTNEENKLIHNNRLMNIFFWIITIDMFFLPYLPFVAVSGSVFLVVIWMILNFKKIAHDKEGIYFYLMIILMIIGTTCNLLYTNTEFRFNTSFATALKRLMQYIISFGMYFFYKEYFKKQFPKISNVIFIFICYVAIFAFLYSIFPYEYATYKYKFIPADNHTRRFLQNLVSYRFNYLWIDPNNLGYLVTGVSAWYLLNSNEQNIKKTIVVLLSLFIVFCTQSNGALIMMLFMGIVFILYSFNKHIKRGISIKTIWFLFFLIICGIVLYKFTTINEYILINYISNFQERLKYYTYSRTGGRLEDLIVSLKYLNLSMLFIGTGNEGISYEIGHIYWIGMYGFIAYIIFIWIMFRREKGQAFKTYLWIIPFFIGFTLNISIGEFKWLGIFFLLIAYSRKSIEKNNERLKE